MCFMQIMEMLCVFHANNGDALGAFHANNGDALCVSCK